jgi:methionyl-tRNA formyltransferase
MDRVLLLGVGPTALSALESLTARFPVVGLIRDTRSSPGGKDEVVERARELMVPVFEDLSIEGVERAVMESRPECTVVSSYDRILPSRVLSRCRFANVHYAPLPEYRGRANVNWAIINGEPETAITIHVMLPGLDAGNILFQKRIPIGPDDTVGELYVKLNDVQREVLGETVARYISGYEGEPQDETAATYGCTRVPDDGEIDWSASNKQIYALVRGLASPYPGAHTYLEGHRITILRALPLTNEPRFIGRIPGRVVGRSRHDGHVDVLTGDGVLRIHEVRAGESVAVPASAVIRSTRQTLGLRTADLLARIEALESRLDSAGGTDRMSLGGGDH